MRATDKVVLGTKSFRAFRSYEIKRKKAETEAQELQVDVSWDLNQDEIKRLLAGRSRKYRKMATQGFSGLPTPTAKFFQRLQEKTEKVYYTVRYDILKNHQKQVQKVFKDVSGEGTVILKRVTSPITTAIDFFSQQKDKKQFAPCSAPQTGLLYQAIFPIHWS